MANTHSKIRTHIRYNCSRMRKISKEENILMTIFNPYCQHFCKYQCWIYQVGIGACQIGSEIGLFAAANRERDHLGSQLVDGRPKSVEFLAFRGAQHNHRFPLFLHYYRWYYLLPEMHQHFIQPRNFIQHLLYVPLLSVQSIIQK